MRRLQALLLVLGILLAGPARAAEPLNCSSEASSQLVVAAGNQVQNYGCGLPAGGLPETGPDDVYEFTCRWSGSVTVSLTGMDCDLDLYVLDGSCDPGAGCVAGGNNSGTVGESATFNCNARESYLIVVEGAGHEAAGCSSGQGRYDLDIVAGGPGCPEDCDNGSDDDGDAATDCADADCAGDPACGGPALEEQGLCPPLVFLPGDINADDTVDVLDATVLQRELAALGPGIAQTCSLRCGNGFLDFGEECELGTLDGATCGSLGFVSGAGALACLPGSCAYDTSGCATTCDPLDPAAVCGPDAHCEPQVDGVPDCVSPVGSGVTLDVCTTSANCAPIYSCVSSILGDVCLPWCAVGGSDCGGNTCTPAGVFVGSQEYGFCDPFL